MVVGTAQVTLQIHGSQSLKDKRQVIRSLIAQTRQQFQVAVAEVGAQDQWQRAVIGLACVSTSASHADEVIAKAVRFMESGRFEAELIGIETEVVHV
jgi:uncharacterized protein YlxP (DUF503 family)